MVAEILAWANVGLALIWAIASLRFYRRLREPLGERLPPESWQWLKMAHALMGAYWCGLYVFVSLTPVGMYDPVWFGQTFVRPAFTLTLAILASGALQRCRAKL